MADSVDLMIDGDEVYDVYSHDANVSIEIEALGGGETSYTMTFPGPDGRVWSVRYVQYDEAAHAAALGVSSTQ